MYQPQYNYGMIGLGTMGCNLVLNMCDHGYSIAGYDKDEKKVTQLLALGEDKKIGGFTDIALFVAALESPKVVMLLVPAGVIVDAVLSDLMPFLKANDVVVDCGNSHFTDTQRRILTLANDGIHFMGLGVSGGETGARFGPSIMPGGNVTAYNKIAPMLQAIAAKVNGGEACTAYMGQGAAGHYVKMVHNGIEYANMQMLAEAYHLLKIYAKQSNVQIHSIFNNWNKGRLQSYLVEISAAIFLQKDDLADGMLIDGIKDTAKQKGTGAWMSQDAMAIGAAIPAIDAAVCARILSSLKIERVAAANLFKNDEEIQVCKDVDTFITLLEEALYAAFILTYAQGLSMLQKASDTYKYEINIATVASIWRGGCIIRAAMLNDIMKAYTDEPKLINMITSLTFKEAVNSCTASLRKVVLLAVKSGTPVPSFCNNLQYFDSYKSAWLPANLVQAQRDFFGAHTYERLDIEGIFHTKWGE